MGMREAVEKRRLIWCMFVCVQEEQSERERERSQERKRDISYIQQKQQQLQKCIAIVQYLSLPLVNYSNFCFHYVDCVQYISHIRIKYHFD